MIAVCPIGTAPIATSCAKAKFYDSPEGDRMAILKDATEVPVPIVTEDETLQVNIETDPLFPLRLIVKEDFTYEPPNDIRLRDTLDFPPNDGTV